jgi:hypothetical protein
MGDRRGSRPGGASFAIIDVDRQARSGGSSSLASGRGMA